jgi:hypothetical protein
LGIDLLDLLDVVALQKTGVLGNQPSDESLI